MKRTTAMTIAILILGTLGLAGAESRTATNTDRKAKPAEMGQVAEERERCGEICLVSDVPIYVPPNRGTTSTRLGGGTRGGISRL